MSRTLAAFVRSLFRKPHATARRAATKARSSWRVRLELLEDRWVPASVQFSSSGETVNQSAGTFSIPVTLMGSPTPQTVVSTLASGFAEPEEIAVDSSGNIYVSDYDNDTISKIAPNGTVSGFAAIGYPEGIAVNAAGDLYVAATGNDSIDEITPAGTVSTFITGLNQQGPVWLACDASGNVYFTNSAMSGEEVEVSKATPAGMVSTFVNNGDYANGLTFHNGDLYLSVFDNSGGSDDTVEQVTPSGLITPYATGFTDPAGLAFDSSGNLYVANSYPGVNTVSEVTPSGAVSTYATGFDQPTGLAYGEGNLFVSNQEAGTVSEVASGVAVPFTLGGSAREGIDFTSLTPSPLFIPAGQTSASITGKLLFDPGANQTLSFTLSTPTGASLGSPSANTLTIDEPAGPTVQFESPGESVPATAGSFNVPVTLSNPPLPTVTTFATGLDEPWGMVADSAGNLYVSNYGNSTISKISPDGTVTLFAAVSDPEGLAINAAGDLFVASSDSIDEITPAGAVSTFLPHLNPQGGVWVACDAEGNVYFTNSAMLDEEVEVLKATPSGQVSAFVNDGTYANGLAFDSQGNLYVSNFENMGALDDSVDVVTPAGVITPYASIATGFSDPAGLAFDAAGNLYVASSYPTVNTVSEVTPAGTISTFASGFSYPKGLVFSGGNLYVDNYIAGTVSEMNGSVSAPFTLSGTAVAGTDYSGVTPSPLTFATGQSSATITGTLIPDPGPNKTLTFTLGNPSGALTGSPAANALTIEEPDKLGPTSGNNQQAAVGTSFGQLVATVTDAGGDPIPGVTVTFAGPASGPGARFPNGDTAVTNASGQATMAATANTVAGSYIVTASVSGVAAPADFSLTNLPGPANHLSFLVQPGNAAAGDAINPAVQVEVFDQYGNLLTNDNTDQVTVTVATGPGPFTNNSSVTETVSGGVATFYNLILDIAGSYTLKETATGGIGGVNSSSFTVSAGNPDHLAFGVQPGTTTAGAAINPAVQVDVLDAYGNPVTTDSTDQVTLAVASGPGGFTAGSSTSAPVIDGVATFGDLVLDTAGSCTLSESAASGLSGNASGAFTIIPGKPDHLAFATLPADVTAGDQISPAIQVDLFDQYGNLLTNDNNDQVTLSVASGPGPLASNGSATATASGGVATFPDVILDTEGDYTLAATGPNGITGPASTSFHVSYGSAEQLAFSVQPGTTTAGDAIDPAVQVEVLDPYGNLVADDNSDQVSIGIASGPGGLTTGSGTKATTVNGVASFNDLVLDTAGSYTLAESSQSGLSGKPSDSFTVTAGSPDHLAFGVQPGTTTAGTAINPAVQVDVLDAYGNPVTTDSTDQVTLAVASGPGGFTAGSSTSAPVIDGVATFGDLVLDTAGSCTLSESAASGLSGNASGAFTIIPGKPDHLAFATLPADVTAGDQISPAIQVDLFDQYGNLLTNDNNDQVTLSVASGPGPLASNGSATATASGGIATFPDAILDTEGDYTLAASGPIGITGPTSTSFHVSYGPAEQLAFSVQPGMATAGDAIDPAVQVEVLDPYGNLVADDSNDTITMSVANGPGQFDTSSHLSETTSGGIATFPNLVLDTAGSYSLSAADANGLTGPSTDSFTVSASTPNHLIFAQEPGTATAGAAINPAVQVDVLDAYGNPVTSDNSDQVTLAVASGPGGFTAGSSTSAPVIDGVATFGDLVLDTAGTYTLETGGLEFPSVASASFSVQPGAASTKESVVTVASGSVAAGTPDTVTLQAVDAYGNDLTTGGLSVAFALNDISGGQGTFGPVKDNGNGTYTASFTGSIAGDNAITATLAGQPLSTMAAAVAVTPGTVDPANSTLTLSSFDIEPEGVIEIALQPFDAYGNAGATGVTATSLSLGGGSPVGHVSTFTSDGDGTYTATLSGQADGSNTVVAAINGVTIGAGSPPTVTVSGNPFSTSRSTVTLSPATVVSGDETTIKMQAKDAHGNFETAGGLTVVFGLSSPKGGQGSFGTVTDNGDGTYTATFTGTLAGSDSITATIDGEKVTAKAPTVKVISGPMSLPKTVVTVSAATVKAGSKITVTLQPEDAAGNKVTQKGLEVVFALGSGSGQGTFGPMTYHANGTYTATFTGTQAGTVSILAFIDSEPVTSPPPSIKVTPGAASPKTSVVTLSSNTVAVGGAITIMLQAEDAYGNDETTGGLKVGFSLGSKSGGKGTFGRVTDNGNGTYTVTFTGTLAGSNSIVATIGGVKVTTSTPSFVIA